MNLLNQEDDIVVEVLLYESAKFNNQQNFRLLSSIDYILKSERFSGSLLQHGVSIFNCVLSYFYVEV